MNPGPLAFASQSELREQKTKQKNQEFPYQPKIEPEYFFISCFNMDLFTVVKS